MKFRKKPVVIEAITFDELVEHGKASGAPLRNGMPWSFDYKGQPITHENDDCYLIPTLEGTMRFDRGDMLITGVKGEIYPCKMDIFRATYRPEVRCPGEMINPPETEMTGTLPRPCATCRTPIVLGDLLIRHGDRGDAIDLFEHEACAQARCRGEDPRA